MSQVSSEHSTPYNLTSRHDAPRMPGPILSVKGLTKHFGGLVALKDVTFDVNDGEVLGLMGPNGAGKTTLFNLISGAYKPNSGTIKFNDRLINGLPPYQICHLGIARTFQVPQPFANLTVEKNLRVSALHGAGLGEKEAKDHVGRVLEVTSLSEKRDLTAGDLPLLDLKRLELARALSSRPTLVLMDEIAAGLTEAEIPALLGILQAMRRNGVAAILIEHIVTVMIGAADRMMVLDSGTKLAEGKPNEIIADKKVIEAYLGDAVTR